MTTMKLLKEYDIEPLHVCPSEQLNITYRNDNMPPVLVYHEKFEEEMVINHIKIYGVIDEHGFKNARACFIGEKA